ncbi:unnamed protein product [Gongylonema pulchrum]|uniref:Transposase n=1 Tax=Gongylonema pulchrum TaxID=637853 RepID=A0A183DA20_9BILA|nr:unnamed protein product [Gongylonema pulchrum]
MSIVGHDIVKSDALLANFRHYIQATHQILIQMSPGHKRSFVPQNMLKQRPGTLSAFLIQAYPFAEIA